MGDTTLQSQGALRIRRGAAKRRRAVGLGPTHEPICCAKVRASLRSDRAHRPALQAGPPNLLRRGSLCLFVSVAMFFVVRVGLR